MRKKEGRERDGKRREGKAREGKGREGKEMERKKERDEGRSSGKEREVLPASHQVNRKTKRSGKCTTPTNMEFCSPAVRTTLLTGQC